MSEITTKTVEKGFIVTEPGKAKEYKTGDWRSQRPIYDKDKCIKCGACYVYCPDMAIKVCKDGYIDVDYYYCKGCGVCARECWTGSFEMVPEGSDKAKAAEEEYNKKKSNK